MTVFTSTSATVATKKRHSSEVTLSATMDALNQAAAAINSTVAYLQSNAWAILFLIGVGYVVKTNVLDVYFSGAPTNNPNRVRSLEEDMRRVRLVQQEAAQKRALEAAKENTDNEREKKHKKNLAAPKKYSGDRVGTDSGYNPMQPSTGSSRGYKPARKTARRG